MTSPIMVFAEQILDEITAYRVAHNSNVPEPIRLACADIQEMFHEQHYSRERRWRDEYVHFNFGDTGFLWGVQFRVDRSVSPGHAFVADREVIAAYQEQAHA